MKHKKTVIIDDRPVEKKWEVDHAAIATIRGNDWLQDFPQLLSKDLEEMQQAFPHWFLVAGNGTTPASCEIDQEFIVPEYGGMRCVKCGLPHSRSLSSLIWVGMLPVQITGADRVEQRIRGLISNGTMRMTYIDSGKALFVLPMVKIIYPTNWDREKPEANYSPEFFETLGIRVGGASHEHHMNSQTKMCLFSSWHKMSIRGVIQNRILPHALAQVKIANGERPLRWFN